MQQFISCTINQRSLIQIVVRSISYFRPQLKAIAILLVLIGVSGGQRQRLAIARAIL
ncbi:hypothetical protein H6S82_15405 [Planktothrix sp. FACHB-1355]|uniref:Uncharacterized protein n=1 Tax=Aerosakkonema funiforme FACHB-1375 TaxID=2949571 RepID=A0A926VMK4_9CYAN|nr:MULTISPECIES: hypothetical protein [Oscillatoriales]MBD2186465.1 hypothetical protein [Aerosakkonema funiforme FACHB-1375]MBD3560228.1 hypothetical protein [Planktothrix sp. FACHB-1355]